MLPWVQIVTWTLLGAAAGAVGGAIAPSKDIPNAGTGALGLVVWGAVVGVLSAFSANFAVRTWPRYTSFSQDTAALDRRRRAHFRRHVFGGALLGALAGGAVLGLAQIHWLWKPVSGGETMGFIAWVTDHARQAIGGGAVAGAAIGLYFWADIAWGENRAGTPVGSLRADRDGGLIRTTAIVVCTTVVLGVLLYGAHWTSDMVFATAAFGFLTLGLALFSGQRAWLAYSALVVHAAFHGRLPFRLMPFLDDAHRLGLLRAVGPVYQFRHAEFQDHLAPLARCPRRNPTPMPHRHRRRHPARAGGGGTGC